MVGGDGVATDGGGHHGGFMGCSSLFQVSVYIKANIYYCDLFVVSLFID